MTLFDEIERTDRSPCRHSESSFAFLNRVNDRCFARVRRLLEDWLSRLPWEMQASVRGRLRRHDFRQFLGAFWELYLHESLRRLGYRLTPEPQVPDSSNRPDFLVEGGQEPFYLEATVASDLTDEQAATERRRGVLYDAIDRLHSPNFGLWIDPLEEGGASPAAGQLRRDLKRWLDGLDPDDVAGHAVPGELESLPSFEWKHEAWHVVFWAIPIKAEARGDPDRTPLGVFGTGEARMVTTASSVRRAVEEKAGRYGQFLHPMVIAILCDGLFASEHSINEALFGKFAVQWQVRPDGGTESREVRIPDSAWLRIPGVPENTRVSAVLTAVHLKPWSVAEIEPQIWHSPWAARPLAEELPYASVRLDLEARQFARAAPARRAHDILGLPPDWPGPEEPFAVAES